MTSPPGPFRFQKVFSDPTPNGLINNRILRHGLELAKKLTDLSEDEFGEFVTILMSVGRKLAFTWIHKERYLSVQERLRDGLIKESKSNDGVHLEVSEELFQEFDEFMVQLKSTLDHVVKIGRPILGANRWTIGTFGDKGRDVIKALERNGGKRIAPQVAGMRTLLFDEHAPWLETFIGLRDRLNHAIGAPVPIESFGVNRVSDGKILVPMWSEDQELGETLEVTWANLFKFVEDFTVYFLFFRAQPDLTLLHQPVDWPSIESPWKVYPRWLMEQQVKKPGWRPFEGSPPKQDE